MHNKNLSHDASVPPILASTNGVLGESAKVKQCLAVSNKVYIATYAALQYTLNNHIHTIFPESIHSYTPKSDRSVPNHVILSAVTISQTHTHAHVCVLQPPTRHLPHPRTSVLSGAGSSFSQAVILVQQAVGTKKHMHEPALALSICSRHSFPCIRTSVVRSH